MIKKEHNEELFDEITGIIDTIVDLFREHEMTVEEIKDILDRIEERVTAISILPSKENEPKLEYRDSKVNWLKSNISNYKE